MKFYPPFMVLAGLIIQVTMSQFLSPPLALTGYWFYVGLALIILGVYPIFAINAAFKANETSIRPDAIPSAFVVSGLFRYSRNPIYVGMTMILVGAGLMTGNLYTLVVAIIFVGAVQEVWIQKEEANLEAQFGESYLEYKKRVRRWI